MAATGSDIHTALKLQALLLADFVYQDRDSGKYVIAGTFHAVNVAAFPATLGRSVGAFVVLTGRREGAEVALSLVEAQTGAVLLRSPPLTLPAVEGDAPLEFAVELPPLPLPRPGGYLVRLTADGAILGDAPFSAREVQA